MEVGDKLQTKPPFPPVSATVVGVEELDDETTPIVYITIEGSDGEPLPLFNTSGEWEVVENAG